MNIHRTRYAVRGILTCRSSRHLHIYASANRPPARLTTVARRAPTSACWLTTIEPTAPLPDPPPLLPLPLPLPEPDPLEPLGFEPEPVVDEGAEGTNVALGFARHELAAADAEAAGGALGLTVALPEKSQDVGLRFVIS